MVFGRNMIPIDEVSIDAPPDSDAWYLALMQHQFPGSFLPFGSEQVVRTAEPWFRLVESSSGRLDYIETIRQWRAISVISAVEPSIGFGAWVTLMPIHPWRASPKRMKSFRIFSAASIGSA